MKIFPTPLTVWILPLLLLASPVAQAELKTFVYGYSSQGIALTASNAEDECPDPENEFQLSNDCRGVLADNEGNYSLYFDNSDLASGELLIVAHDFDFLEADGELTEDTYLLLESQRRADEVSVGETNNGWDVNALSEAIISAIESVSHLPASELGDYSTRLIEALAGYDLSEANAHMAVSENIAEINLEQLDEHQQQLLVRLAELLIASQGEPAVADYLAKTVTQALLDPEAMPELVLMATEVVDALNLASGTQQAVLLLEAERYLINQGEVIQLTTTNSINASQFFAYTWQGVEGADTQHANFSKDQPGSYMVCATGEISNANESSTDCIRIVVLGPVEAIADASSYRLAVGASTQVNGTNSINADSFAWSGGGSFANNNSESTTWTAPLVPGSYALMLTVNGEFSDTITIDVYDLLPLAIAQTDTPILTRNDAAVSALLKSFSISSDGSAIDSLEWRIASQPEGAAATLASATSKTTHFTTDVVGLYTIELHATKALNSDVSTLEILVEQQGMPTAIAGADRVTFRENIIMLDGRASYHADDLPLSYNWSATGGALATPSNAVTQYSSLVLGDFVAQLLVADGDNRVADELNISVINRPPQISDDSRAQFLDGLLEGQVIARDGDLDILTYELVDDPSNGGLTLNVDTGEYYYLSGGDIGCRFKPDHKPYDNGNGGKDVPVIKLCAEHNSVAPGAVVNLSTSNSINTSKFSGFTWKNAQGDPNDITLATFSSDEIGMHEVCVIGNVGNSRNTSTACVQIEVTHTPTGGGDLEDGYADGFKVRVSDGYDNSRIATIKVNLEWYNTPPVSAAGGPYSVAEDEWLEGDLIAVDDDQHVLRYEIVSNGSLGVAQISDPASGRFIYTPNPNVFGSDQFTFKANDGFDDSNISTVTIEIASVNDAPVISFEGLLTTLEDQLVSAAISGIDNDGDLLTYRFETPAALADLTWNDINNGLFSYTPHANKHGADTFVVYANDGTTDSNRLTITAHITSVNDQPSAEDIAISTWSDTPVDGAIVAADADRDALSYHINSAPSKGELLLDAATGAFTFTPNGVDIGSDSASFYVDDGTERSAIATLYIEIAAANVAPSADAQSITVMAGVTYQGVLSGSDPENEPFAYALDSLPSLGVSRMINPDSGEFRYATNSATDQLDSFTFQVNDGQKLSESATVEVNIIGSNRVCRGPGHTPYDQDGDGFADYVEIAFGTSVSDAAQTPAALLANLPYSFSFNDDDDVDGYLDIIELWFSTNHRDSADAIIASPVSIPFCMTATGDLQPPALQGFDISTPVLDVSSGNAMAGFTVTTIDNAVGVKRLNVTLVSPSGEVRKVAGIELEAPLSVLFAELQSDPFSQYSEEGNWVVETLEITDAKNNVTLLDTASLFAFGYPTVVQVINPNQDVTAPLYSAFDVLTPVVDLAQPSPIAQFSYTASDDLSGVALIELTLVSPSGNNFKHVSHHLTPPELEIAAQLSTDDFPLYSEVGIWQVKELVVVDEAGNRNEYDTAAIQAEGWATDVELINVLVDVETPLESYFEVLTPRLNATSGNSRAVCAVTAHDTESGVSEILLNIISPSGNQTVQARYNNLEPSTSLSADVVSDIFPRDAELGTWDVAELIIVDGSGNQHVVSSTELNSQGFSTAIELVNPTVIPPEVGTEPLDPVVIDDPANTAPVAYCDSYSLDEDSLVENTLRASDDQGDLLTFYLVTQPEQGMVELLDGATGAFRYTPQADFYGSDSFSFMVDDGQLNSNVCTIQFTMSAVIDEPFAEDISLTTRVNTSVDGSLVGGTADNSPVGYRVIDLPSHGTIEFVHGVVGYFRYTPNQDYIGDDSFTYVSEVDTLTSAQATASITVLPYDDGVLFEVLTPVVIRSDDNPVIQTAITPTRAPADIRQLLVTLTSPTGETFTFSKTSFSEATTYPVVLSKFLTAEAALGDWLFSDLTIIPNSGSTFVVADLAAAGFSNIAEVVDNTPPVALDASYELILGETLAITLGGSDANGDTFSYQLHQAGHLGEAILADPTSSAVSYSAHSLGQDQVTFTVNDGLTDSNIATLTIDVIAPQQEGIVLPVAFDDEIAVMENTAYLDMLDANKGSASMITYAIVDQPTQGSLTLVNNQSGEYIYRPAPDILGKDSFTFQVSGDGLTSRLATISIDVIDANGAPFANDMNIEMYVNGSYRATLLASDPDQDPLSYQLTTSPQIGTVVIDGTTGAFVYTLSSNEIGEDSFTYSVNDGEHDPATATVTITIISDATACGVGGIYLSDIDGDGYSNSVELVYGSSAEDTNQTPDNLGSIDFESDWDHDGYADYLEEWVGSNLMDSDSAPLNLDPYYLPSCFQPDSDGIKPRLQGFNILSSSLDINSDNNVLEIAMVLSDNASGLRRARIGLLSPAGEYYTSSVSFDNHPRLHAMLFRASGFSQYAEQGVWHVTALTLFDEAGNVLSLTEDELQQADLLTTFEVTNGNSDAVPPSLVGLSIVNSIVYPQQQEGDQFAFELSLSDSGAGVSSARIDLASPSGTEISIVHLLDTPQTNATLTLQSDQLSRYLEMGDWTITGVMVFDAAGNSAQLVDQLQNNTVQVDNLYSDNQPPVLDMFAIMNSDIYPLDPAGARISYSVAAYDNAAGIELLYINLRGPSGQLLPTWGSFTDPVPLSVLTQITSTTLSRMMEEGVWQVESVEIIDEAGNSRFVTGDELQTMGYSTRVNVLY